MKKYTEYGRSSIVILALALGGCAKSASTEVGARAREPYEQARDSQKRRDQKKTLTARLDKTRATVGDTVTLTESFGPVDRSFFHIDGYRTFRSIYREVWREPLVPMEIDDDYPVVIEDYPGIDLYGSVMGSHGLRPDNFERGRALYIEKFKCTQPGHFTIRVCWSFSHRHPDDEEVEEAKEEFWSNTVHLLVQPKEAD